MGPHYATNAVLVRADSGVGVYSMMPSDPQNSPQEYPEMRRGLMYAGCAFGWWAIVVPTYFKTQSPHPIDGINRNQLVLLHLRDLD